jgi:hypothetical protein
MQNKKAEAKLTVPLSYFENHSRRTINTEQGSAQFTVIFLTTYLQNGIQILSLLCSIWNGLARCKAFFKILNT